MRFVMIQIPDNEEADAFIKAAERGDLLFGFDKDDGTGEYGYKGLTGASVPGVWAVPTKFCECPDYAGKGVRSSKYGWHVHAKCAKPRKTAQQYPRNLKEAGRTIKELVYFLGFRADRKSVWGLPNDPA
jgi:hypothetical protein